MQVTCRVQSVWTLERIWQIFKGAKAVGTRIHSVLSIEPPQAPRILHKKLLNMTNNKIRRNKRISCTLPDT
ncbi:hypothetical protein Hamer_G010757 [Homarus americanus]|uniref:Uncharacterized protein n=1 Tax=Homarus americanus TaxID=6706 RepID=A0A8J5JUJ6_HOMAM|nr:hypothetical protein Hamer_G010757 [Homarus americanus]